MDSQRARFIALSQHCVRRGSETPFEFRVRTWGGRMQADTTKVSYNTALAILDEHWPNQDDPATPAQVLAELRGRESVETSQFSMWRVA